jgi:hypothetical protein
MRQKHSHSKTKGKAKKNIANNFVSPKNQSHQKRHTGVTGKKQITGK